MVLETALGRALAQETTDIALEVLQALQHRFTVQLLIVKCLQLLAAL